MERQMKELRTMMWAVIHTKQAPQDPKTGATQRILEELKVVQEKMQRGVTQMAETESLNDNW